MFCFLRGILFCSYNPQIVFEFPLQISFHGKLVKLWNYLNCVTLIILLLKKRSGLDNSLIFRFIWNHHKICMGVFFPVCFPSYDLSWAPLSQVCYDFLLFRCCCSEPDGSKAGYCYINQKATVVEVSSVQMLQLSSLLSISVYCRYY